MDSPNNEASDYNHGSKTKPISDNRFSDQMIRRTHESSTETDNFDPKHYQQEMKWQCLADDKLFILHDVRD